MSSLTLSLCSFFTYQSVQGSGWRTLSQVISLLLCTAVDGERSTRPAETFPAGIGLHWAEDHGLCTVPSTDLPGSQCYLYQIWTTSQQLNFGGSQQWMSPSLGACGCGHLGQLTSKIGTFFHSCRVPKQCPKCVRLWECQCCSLSSLLRQKGHSSHWGWKPSLGFWLRIKSRQLKSVKSGLRRRPDVSNKRSKVLPAQGLSRPGSPQSFCLLSL